MRKPRPGSHVPQVAGPAGTEPGLDGVSAPVPPGGSAEGLVEGPCRGVQAV